MSEFQKESERRVDELLDSNGGIGTFVTFFLILFIVSWTP
jgi:hypothetical protein